MKKLLFFILLLSQTTLFSQDLPTIIPPSPEATSLAKFTEIPVSHYTGIPNINVPIYEINFDGLKIPISISYHARGVKVEEIASRVGIGWALNAGGAITRQIRDQNDFNGPYGYYNGNFYENFATNPQVRSNVAWTDTDANNRVDFVPDQFSFNFLGYSGKFIFDQKTKEPILQSYDDLEIKKMGNSENDLYFIITTQDGFRFYFGKSHDNIENRTAKSKDQTIVSSAYHAAGRDDVTNNASAPLNTWHLMDIVSPNGKKIRFMYDLEEPYFYRRSYDKKEITTGHTSYFTKYHGYQYQIQEIIFDQGSVKFIPKSTGRDDLDGGFALASIEVVNKYQRVKKYNFNYSYSTSPNTNIGYNINYFLFDWEVKARKRLFLDNIQVIDNNNTFELYRAFEYTNKNDMPNRFSNSQDLWGYFNNANNGPYLAFYSYPGYPINREVDTLKAKVGLINKMSYPTGGYTAYTFEANKSIIPEYFKNLYFANPNPTVQDTFAYLSKSTFTLVSSTSQKNTYESDSFDIFSSDIGPINVQIYLNGDAINCEVNQNGYQSSNCNYIFSIVDDNGHQVYYPSGTPILLFKQVGRVSYNMAIEPLQTGTYKIRAEVSTGTDSPNDRNNSFVVNLSWGKSSNPDHPDLIYSGGNRIKKIENHTVDNGTIIRTYEYKKVDNSSSGLLFALPSYWYVDEFTVLSNGVQIPIKKFNGARPGSPLTYEQGNHVGYSHVTEYIDSDTQQGEGGKIEYQFTSMPDGGNFYKYPYTLSINNEWLRGKPLLMEYYKKEGNSINDYNIIKKEEFTYKYADGFSNLTFSKPSIDFYYIIDRLQYFRPLVTYKREEYYAYSASPNSPYVNPEDYKIYYLTGGTQKLFQKKETTYNESGEFSTTTNYNYDYTNHYQIVNREVADSQGSLLKIENNYTIFSNPLRFRIIPIKIKNYRGTSKLSEQQTIYDTFSGNYLPKLIQTSKGSGLLEDRIIYHDYDDKGNPIEVSKKDGTHIIYIWGYNKTQPIAKIENLTSSELTSVISSLSASYNTLEKIQEISNLDNTQGTTTSENNLRTALTALRNALTNTNAQVTTFTYDPLIGVTSVTDPRGRVVYYEYDSFNRLKQVKDHDGNILNKNEYNYKN
ncbi:RHS repeat domain-containing protein [Polaribacter cellanae]|uniref:RHS repeat protein n=1 Tax=Polaribacter cellanae TaxID=2818493 RepID=A0A975CP15_9FLAO|nr:RHS repeat domain-containing protein [Polaribacter cellanae]QTE21237.1 RHS repeat protein [Polaribacter cellanae]